MMYFFDDVQIYSTTGKSARGKALQEMAERFKNVLVQGEYAPESIVIAMRKQVEKIDKYSRGRETFVFLTSDNTEGNGQIVAIPVSDYGEFDKQPYFRICFHVVARTATILEAVALTEGGEV